MASSERARGRIALIGNEHRCLRHRRDLSGESLSRVGRGEIELDGARLRADAYDPRRARHRARVFIRVKHQCDRLRGVGRHAFDSAELDAPIGTATDKIGAALGFGVGSKHALIGIEAVDSLELRVLVAVAG